MILYDRFKSPHSYYDNVGMLHVSQPGDFVGSITSVWFHHDDITGRFFQTDQPLPGSTCEHSCGKAVGKACEDDLEMGSPNLPSAYVKIAIENGHL